MWLAQTPEATAKTVMEANPAITVAMIEEFGPTVEVTTTTDGRYIIEQEANYGAVTRADITKNRCGDVSVAYEYVQVDASVPANPFFAKVQAHYEADMAAKLDQKVTTSSAEFTRFTLGPVVAAGLREHMNADLGWMNGGGVRTTLAAGPVTLRHLHSILPFGNRVMKIQVTGAQLVTALNQGADSNPAGYGGFPRPAGFTYRYNPAAAAGQRISDVKLTDGTAVDPAKKYTLAVTEYVVKGGDGGTAFKDAPVVVAPTVTDVTTLIEYAKKHTITPLPMGVTVAGS